MPLYSSPWNAFWQTSKQSGLWQKNGQCVQTHGNEVVSTMEQNSVNCCFLLLLLLFFYMSAQSVIVLIER